MDSGISPGQRTEGGRRRLDLLRYSLLASAVLLTACSGGGDEEASAATATPFEQPPVISLTASPSSVDSNGSSTLDWSVRNATSCQASGAWLGEKKSLGTENVGPLTITSVFILSCTGPGGIASRSVTVDVAGSLPPPAPTMSLNANPTSVTVGDTATLSWSSTNTTTCQASGAWSGTKATAGSEVTSALTSTSTFTLVCSGAGGTAGQSVSVAVGGISPPPAPTVSLSASPLSINYNDSTTLTWSSTNVDSCAASGDWSGTKATSGNEIKASLKATSTFTLTCTGPGGGAGGSVTVTVAPPPLPTVNLSANPTTVSTNGSSMLTWSSTDATTCIAGGDTAGGTWSGNKSLSGNQSVGPITQTSTFTLTCTGPGGSTNRPVTVTVQAVNGTADLSWIPPTTNEDGSPVSLTGFNVYQGSSATSLSKIATVGATTTTYKVSNLPAGTHYFAVTAVGGGESQFSNVASKTIF